LKLVFSFWQIARLQEFFSLHIVEDYYMMPSMDGWWDGWHDRWRNGLKKSFMMSSLYLGTIRSYCLLGLRGSFILPLLYVILYYHYLLEVAKWDEAFLREKKKTLFKFLVMISFYCHWWYISQSFFQRLVT
jgi:hypothetical protein